MTRSLAPRSRTRPAPRPVPADPKALWSFLCDRCGRVIVSRTVVSECFSCTTAAVAVYQLGPIMGEVSGS